MEYNKKEYIKPSTFPSWARVNPKLADKKVYYKYKNGIKADFEAEQEHSNHIEMAGSFCSSIISYRLLKGGAFELYRFAVFPSIRVNPNNTHGSLCEHFEGVCFLINKKEEKLKSVEFNGILSFNSQADNVKIKRSIFPAKDKKALIEEVEIFCEGDAEIEITNAFSKRAVDACYTPYSFDIELKKETYINGERAENASYFLSA